VWIEHLKEELKEKIKLTNRSNKSADRPSAKYYGEIHKILSL